MRWQTLPQPFDLWIDGLEVPVIEELGAGTAALHETDPAERRRLVADPAWRKQFRKQWANPLAPKAWHRDLGEPRIIDCPDRSVVGKSFGEVAAERGIDPLDCFLDLQVEHGNDLRWYTVVGNDRPAELAYVVDHPAVLVGFSDAGAAPAEHGVLRLPPAPAPPRPSVRGDGSAGHERRTGGPPPHR